MKDAVRAGHPIGKQNRLPSALQEALDFVTSKSIYEVAKHRHDTLAFWLERAKSLAAQETELHANLHESLKDIIKPKRLLLWKEMLQFYGYPDLEVFEEVCHGTRLAGAAPIVPSFDPCFKPAKLTLKELGASAETSRAALLATVRSSGDVEIDGYFCLQTILSLRSTKQGSTEPGLYIYVQLTSPIYTPMSPRLCAKLTYLFMIFDRLSKCASTGNFGP